MRRLKIAVAQIKQETNTFNPVKTTINTFRHYGFYEGKELVKVFHNRNELGGFITALRKAQSEVVPLFRINAWPGGMVTNDALEWIEKSLTVALEKTLPLDGILLSLHGAMASEKVYDADGFIIQKVNEIVGSEIPIVVTFDLHANVTQAKVKGSTAILGFHTNPHVDLFQTGEKAASLLVRIIKSKIKPEAKLFKIPMITPAEKLSTEKGAFKDVFKLVKASMLDSNIIFSSLFPVQPWLDVPDLGWSVLLYGYTREKTDKWIRRIAGECWSRRRDFNLTRIPISKAVSMSVSNENKPVIISDGSDATNAGAPGDSTVILREMIQQNIQCESLITFVDPEAVEIVADAGVGSSIKISIGGKKDPYSEPLEVSGIVKTLFNGRYTISGGHGGDNVLINTGLTVVLQVRNIYIVISEYPGPGDNPSVYRTVGLKPENAQIVVVKSPLGFRASYGSFSAKVIFPKTLGVATSDFNLLCYRRIPRPFYPFDEGEQFNDLKKEFNLK